MSPLLTPIGRCPQGGSRQTHAIATWLLIGIVGLDLLVIRVFTLCCFSLVGGSTLALASLFSAFSVATFPIFGGLIRITIGIRLLVGLSFGWGSLTIGVLGILAVLSLVRQDSTKGLRYISRVIEVGRASVIGWPIIRPALVSAFGLISGEFPSVLVELIARLRCQGCIQRFGATCLVASCTGCSSKGIDIPWLRASWPTSARLTATFGIGIAEEGASVIVKLVPRLDDLAR